MSLQQPIENVKARVQDIQSKIQAQIQEIRSRLGGGQAFSMPALGGTSGGAVMDRLEKVAPNVAARVKTVRERGVLGAFQFPAPQRVARTPVFNPGQVNQEEAPRRRPAISPFA